MLLIHPMSAAKGGGGGVVQRNILVENKLVVFCLGIRLQWILIRVIRLIRVEFTKYMLISLICFFRIVSLYLFNSLNLIFILDKCNIVNQIFHQMYQLYRRVNWKSISSTSCIVYPLQRVIFDHSTLWMKRQDKVNEVIKTYEISKLSSSLINFLLSFLTSEQFLVNNMWTVS